MRHEQLLGDLRVREPARDAPSTSRSRSVSASRPGFGCRDGVGGLLRELLDEPAGDLRREQRVAVGDDAHRREQLLGQRVLEQEAARAGAQRFEHVLVEIERGQDRARGSTAVASSPRDATRRLEPVHLRHPDVHEDDVGTLERHQVDGFGAVRGLADDLDVVGRSQQHGEAAAHQRLVVGDRRRGSLRCSVRKRRTAPRSRRRRGAGLERAAVHRDALAHPDQPVAAVGRPGR